MKLNKAYDLIVEKLSNTNILERANVDEPLEIYSDRCIVAGDWHIPFVKEKLFDKLIEEAQKFDIKDLIVAGDFWDCYKISKFMKRQRIDFKDEKKVVNAYLDVVCEEFEHVYFTIGNHEYRWLRLFEGEDDMKGLFDSLGNEHNNYTTTNNDFLILNDMWRICHPKEYSRTSLNVARRLASKYHMNIITGHQHSMARDYDISGEYTIMDSGGMFDKDKIDYLQATSTYPTHKGGFIIIMDNNAIGVYE